MDLHTVEQLVRADTTRWQSGDAYVAGGSWLFSQPQPAVRRLLDLTALGWPALASDAAGLTIAATCTLADLAAYRAPNWPAVALFATSCDALLGSFKIQAVATVGGNICLALPAAPMIALTAALDGDCELWSADATATRLSVLDLVTGDHRTALLPGQLLRSVRLPAAALASRVAFRQFSLSTLGRSAAVVIGRVGADGATITIAAATARPVQLRYLQLPDAAVTVRDVDARIDRWHDDVHGDPRWRRAITLRLVADVVAELA